MEFWQIMERKLARRLEGWITPGSGNQNIKGDVHTREFVLEAKWRANQIDEHTFYLDLMAEWLTKVTKQATALRKEPIIAVCIANVVTYCLVRIEYWSRCTGRLHEPNEYLKLTTKQLRMKSNADWAYKVVQFQDGQEWIILPEDDFIFLVNQERGPKEKMCRKKTKTPEQIERDQQRKESMRAKRKEFYKKRKQQQKQDRMHSACTRHVKPV